MSPEQELAQNIHKVKLHPSGPHRTERTLRQKGDTLAYAELPDKLKLRAFFQKVTKKRSEKKEPEFKVKYTLFLQPMPFFCRYNEGDEELTEFEPLFFENFRDGRAMFIRLLDVWYRRYRRATTAGALP